jgi:hypothetical protein
MRHIITLLLMLPLLADAQIYIDSYRFGIPPVPGLLLDSFPGAAAAYSLRLLDNDYTGQCVKVRRKSDGDSTDIGFSGGVLDTNALKTFCGTGGTDTCWVRVWYDQSGNNRTARSDTAARQPMIMTSGVIRRQGGTPTIFYDGATGADAKLFRIDAGSMTNNISHFSAFDVRRLADTTSATTRLLYSITTGTTTAARILSQKEGAGQKYQSLGRRLDADAIDGMSSANNHPGTQIGVTALYNYSSATLNAFVNGSTFATDNTFQTAGNTSATNPLFAYIGSNAPFTATWQGTITELIFYESDQSTNRAAIETNINAFYSIY